MFDNTLKTLRDIFPEHKTNGLKMDTPKERAEYFAKLWDEWKDTEITLNAIDNYEMYGIRYDLPKIEIRKILNAMEISEFWDYQIRGRKIRFKNETMAMIFRLKL